MQNPPWPLAQRRNPYTLDRTLCPSDPTSDIVNIGLHFFHKDVRLYAASCSEV